MCGVFKICEGVGHRLLTHDVEFILFSVFGILGLILLLIAEYGKNDKPSA